MHVISATLDMVNAPCAGHPSLLSKAMIVSVILSTLPDTTASNSLLQSKSKALGHQRCHLGSLLAADLFSSTPVGCVHQGFSSQQCTLVWFQLLQFKFLAVSSKYSLKFPEQCCVWPSLRKQIRKCEG